MKITIVGSGDAFGSGGRFNTCFRIETLGRDLLLDCGASSLPALKAQRVDPNAIDGVLLSHLHGDHFGGVVFLVMDGHFLSRRSRPLLIAGPPGTRTRLDAALEVFFPRSTTIAWRYPWQVVEIVPGTPAEFLGLSVQTVEVVHQSGAPSTAVRISDGSRVLAYSGDTEWTDALISVATDADLFIAECYEHARAIAGHMNWGKLSAKLSALGARKIMVTHMNPSMLARTEEARASGVLIASDGMVLEL
jgi:ribonuclease BN (tRNA processing enzyme)